MSRFNKFWKKFEIIWRRHWYEFYIPLLVTIGLSIASLSISYFLFFMLIIFFSEIIVSSFINKEAYTIILLRLAKADLIFLFVIYANLIFGFSIGPISKSLILLLIAIIASLFWSIVHYSFKPKLKDASF
ncbi:MAG: hypothetical protein KJ718_04250 [Nanoarchaeota archaeon]|nr:hypothetical protein [Nanoarchaeota archaeon]MBU1051740.1 hypothetical protein [Nanoarchaeota archaeon]